MLLLEGEQIRFHGSGHGKLQAFAHVDGSSAFRHDELATEFSVDRELQLLCVVSEANTLRNARQDFRRVGVEALGVKLAIQTGRSERGFDRREWFIWRVANNIVETVVPEPEDFQRQRLFLVHRSDQLLGELEDAIYVVVIDVTYH